MFILTERHVRSIFEPAKEGNWQPLLDALDADVKWWINDDKADELTHTGIYVGTPFPYLHTQN